MQPFRALVLATVAASLSGCGLGLNSFYVDSGLPDETDGDDGFSGGATGGTSGGGGNSGGGSGGTGTTDGADGGGGADGGTGTDGTTGLDPLTISTTTPNYGTTLGGQRVTITGGPFDATARVWFGPNEATVRSVDGSTIEVDSPSTANTGLVDVRVETTTHEGELESAFTYWDDNTGNSTALGVYFFEEQVGSYWSGATTASGSAAVYFTEPSTAQWSDLVASGIDVCADADTYTYSGTIYVLDPGASSLTVTPTSGSSVSLTWDSSLSGYTNNSLTTSTYRASTAYTLQPMAGGAFPEVSVSNFLRTPARPSVSVPYITGSSPPNISRYQTFSWSSVGADWVLIEMSVWNTAGTGYQQTVSCVARDDGSFTFDGSKFSSWPSSFEYRQVDVRVGYAYESTGTFPWDNSSINMTGLYQVYGAGFAY